jgi:hypothetical protein
MASKIKNIFLLEYYMVEEDFVVVYAFVVVVELEIDLIVVVVVVLMMFN